MIGRLKIKPIMFLAYDYDREENYINAMSKKGWQLVKGGLFHHTYVKSDEEYCYKLDFNNKVHFSMDEHCRYLSFYHEQGWEHINSTINGWHYFRKKYDPKLGEEDYNIYTDDTSLQEMLGRWNKIARLMQVITIFYFLYYLFYFFQSHSFLALAASALMLFPFALFQIGISNMRAKRIGFKSRSTTGTFGGYLLISALLLSFCLSFFLVNHEYYYDKIDYTAKINQHTPDYSDTLTLKKDGTYYLDVKCKSERGIVAVHIINNGTLIFKAGGGDFHISNKRLNLKAGDYTVEVIYYLEDYKEEFNKTYGVIDKYYITGDLNEKSDVDIFVGLKKQNY